MLMKTLIMGVLLLVESAGADSVYTKFGTKKQPPKSRAEKKKAWEREVQDYRTAQQRKQERQRSLSKCAAAGEKRFACVKAGCAYSKVEVIDKAIDKYCSAGAIGVDMRSLIKDSGFGAGAPKTRQ